jgi:transposase-like protein
MGRHPQLAKLLQPRHPVVEIARACGITKGAVSNWRTVPRAHAETVARVLGVPVEDVPVTPAAKN